MDNDRDSQISSLIEKVVAKLDSRLTEVLHGHHDSLTGKMEQLLEQWKNYMDAVNRIDWVNDEAARHSDPSVMPVSPTDSATGRFTTQLRFDDTFLDDSEESDEAPCTRRSLATASCLVSTDSMMASRKTDKLFPQGRHVLRESRKPASEKKGTCFRGTLLTLYTLPQSGAESPASLMSRFNHTISHPTKAFWSAQDKAAEFVTGSCFDIFCGGVIMLNTILIGVEAEFSSSEHGHRNLRLDTVYLILSLWYIFELLLRLFAFGRDYFVGPDWRWNWFDFFLVCTVVADIAMQSWSMFRMVRFFRIARAVRLYRQLRWFAEFRKMIYSIASSSMTLLWSFVLLFFMLYAFAVYVAGNVKDFTTDARNTDHESYSKLRHRFGSLWKSIYTLSLCISTGVNWGEVAKILGDVDQILPILLSGFIFIVLFGALNVVMAVFVDSAMQSTQHYKDLMVQENQSRKELYMRHIRDIFKEMDTDGSGTLSRQEMVDFLTNESLQLSTYFDALELNAYDAHALFRLLDDDKSGAVDIDEFCSGCLRLKGVAKSFDVHCGIYEMGRMSRDITNRLVRVGKGLKKNHRRLQKIDLKMGALTSMPRLVRASAPTPIGQRCNEHVLGASNSLEALRTTPRSARASAATPTGQRSDENVLGASSGDEDCVDVHYI